MGKPDTAEPKAPERTPENTPLPGGGRWVWDAESNNWAPAPEPDQE